MKIATWNINGLRARLDFLRLWLSDRRPDLVGLQELKMTTETFPHEELAEAGYHAAVHGQKSWNGVAVLSRSPLEVVQRGLPGQEELGSRLLTVRTGDLELTTVYCPNGKRIDHDDFPRKLAWFDALVDHIGSTMDPSRPAVVCGDFNICPGPLDSWNWEELEGTLFHTEEERRRLHRLFDLGLEDLYRALNPERRSFSWWDYRGGSFHRGRGLRIDLVLATRSVVEAAEAAENEREWRKKHDGLTPSDHAPVSVELAGGR